MFRNPSNVTPELQILIDELAERGGGEIDIPPGVYGFTPIRLRSNICLRLAAGARLVASPRRKDYFQIGYDHNEMGQVTSAVYAMDEEQITVCGEGTIDLNGDAFYHLDRPTDVVTVGPEITQAHLDEAPRRHDWRVSQPIFFLRCRGLRWDGVRVVNAPCWTLSFVECQGIKMLGITIDNSMIIPNSDGMHFSSSRDIIVSDCQVSAGDDCIAFTAITDFDKPCQDIVVSNCIFRSASKAMSVGYMHSIVRNVLIQNVIVRKSNRGLVIMCNPGTGLVENVRISNCILEGRCYGGNWWGNGESIVFMATPHHHDGYRDPKPATRFDMAFRNINVSGTLCRSPRPVTVVASDARLVRNVEMKDLTIQVIPDELPSLKGNAVDLAPGPENLLVPEGRSGIFTKNAPVRVTNVVDEEGRTLDRIELG